MAEFRGIGLSRYDVMRVLNARKICLYIRTCCGYLLSSYTQWRR